MPTATQNETRGALLPVEAGAAISFGALPRETPARTEPVAELAEWTTRLVTLLEEDPVDLARVSGEIRSQPELAEIVRRIAAWLQFAPEGTMSSVEESAIVIGTERLRAVLHGWPALQKALHEGPGTAALASNQEIANRNPGSLDFAGLARLLGLGDCASAAAGPETAEISAILLRDFLALVPTTISLQLVSGVRQGSGR